MIINEQNLKKSLEALKDEYITEDQFYKLMNAKEDIVLGILKYMKGFGLEKEKIIDHLLEKEKEGQFSYVRNVLSILNNEHNSISNNIEKIDALLFSGDKCSNEIYCLGKIYSNDEIWNDMQLRQLLEDIDIKDDRRQTIIVDALINALDSQVFQDGKNRDLYAKLCKLKSVDAIELGTKILEIDEIKEDQELSNHLIDALVNFKQFKYEQNNLNDVFINNLKKITELGKLNLVRDYLMKMSFDIQENGFNYNNFVLICVNTFSEQLSDDALEKLLSQRNYIDIFLASKLFEIKSFRSNPDLIDQIMLISNEDKRISLVNIIKANEEIYEDEEVLVRTIEYAKKNSMKQLKDHFCDKKKGDIKKQKEIYENIAYLISEKRLDKDQLLQLYSCIDSVHETEKLVHNILESSIMTKDKNKLKRKNSISKLLRKIQ